MMICSDNGNVRIIQLKLTIIRVYIICYTFPQTKNICTTYLFLFVKNILIHGSFS